MTRAQLLTVITTSITGSYTHNFGSDCSVTVYNAGPSGGVLTSNAATLAVRY